MNADAIDLLKSLILLKLEGSLSHLTQRETILTLCELLSVHRWCDDHSPLGEFTLLVYTTLFSSVTSHGLISVFLTYVGTHRGYQSHAFILILLC